MNGQIVRTTSEDGLELQGILYDDVPNKDTIVIHIHGSNGNFYENYFLDYMAKQYNSCSIVFLPVSTRGRDYYSDFIIKKSDGSHETIKIGGIREKFSDCTKDIMGWYKYIKSLKYRKIILQGHSLGAMKVVYFASDIHECKLDGIILLSPPDLFGLMNALKSGRMSNDLKYANKYRELHPSKLMPEDAYFDPITVEAYYDLISNKDLTGMFAFYDKTNLENPRIKNVTTNVLGTFGTIDEAVVDEINECERLLKLSLVNSKMVETKIFKGANHYYKGQEDKMAKYLSTWVSKEILGEK